MVGPTELVQVILPIHEYENSNQDEDKQTIEKLEKKN